MAAHNPVSSMSEKEVFVRENIDGHFVLLVCESDVEAMTEYLSEIRFPYSKSRHPLNHEVGERSVEFRFVSSVGKGVLFEIFSHFYDGYADVCFKP